MAGFPCWANRTDRAATRGGPGLAATSVPAADAATEAIQVAYTPYRAAHETLEQARDILSDLRRRNNVVVFSDQMNAYHAEMERVLADGAAMLAQPGGDARLAAVSGALAYLAARLASEAPQTYARNEEFVALVGALQKAVADLQQALFNDDRPAAQEALRKLKPPYAELFLKFG